MTKRVHPVIVPKKGKARLVVKRPAMPKSSTWKKVPYIREKTIVGSRGLRKDQTKWKRSLSEILNADNKGIIKLLVADKLLLDWTGTPCPRCCKGTLPPHAVPGQLLEAQVLRLSLPRLDQPLSSTPAVSEKTGSATTKYLQTQASMLLLHLHQVPQATIQALLGVNHKAVEGMQMKLFDLRRNYVEFEQKNIIFGDGKTWKDVEADEACFDKKDITNDVQFQHLMKKKDTTMMWEQWAGVAQRGFPKSLVLHRVDPKLTVKRAPGPFRFSFIFHSCWCFEMVPPIGI